MNQGRLLLVLSIFTRLGVILLLCTLAFFSVYLNYKTAYNHPRLVGLSSGPWVEFLYQSTDDFLKMFGDPIEVAQENAGMTWSIRLAGVPFTDPVAGLSLLIKNAKMPLGFALGMLIPLGLALIFGRIFCSFVCPASLLFFFIARIRRLLNRFLYMPDLRLSRGVAWGVLLGGLASAWVYGHGIWSLVLPYLSVGQTLFHAIAFGTLSVTVSALAFFAVLDFFAGSHFTCRFICPTGRLLGLVGAKAVVSIRRDASRCLESCTACHDVCPTLVNPKADESKDCSLCGECVVICPSQCLGIGRKI